MSRPLKLKVAGAVLHSAFQLPDHGFTKGCLRGRTADIFPFLPMRGVSYDFSCDKQHSGVSAVPEKSFTPTPLCSALSRSYPAVYFPACILFR
jgi:hypothetical protein